jgi:hypothetical protein
MNSADPNMILDLAMTRCLAQMRGRFDHGAPVTDQWAQAVSAALDPDTEALRRGQTEAVRTWLGQAASDEAHRQRRVALTTLCMHLPARPAEDGGVRDDPGRLIALAEFYLHIGDEDDE